MRKIFLISSDFIQYSDKNHCYDFIEKIVDSKNKIIFYSRTKDKINTCEFIQLKTKYPSDIALLTRQELKNYLTDKDKSLFVVIGVKDQDFYLANHNKLLQIVPTWYKSNIDARSLKYGITINNFEQLYAFCETIYNQNYWYSSNKLDDSTYIFSLSDARSKRCSQSAEEKEVIEIFHDILKNGELNFYTIFYYHFLSSISNNQALFNDINIWGIFPSSSGGLNKEMYDFKEQVRYFMNGREPQKTNEVYWKYPNILIRHTPTTKSHHDKDYERIEYGATKHLNTIHLNPYYDLKKLRGKNVCIFDDYLTHGNSFECARNLLKAAGVNKIIFVTLGTFNKNYQFQNYQLSGNIFSPNYNYKLINRFIIDKNSFKINKQAKNEVENLHHIFNL
jgi:hypothetical protein